MAGDDTCQSTDRSPSPPLASPTQTLLFPPGLATPQFFFWTTQKTTQALAWAQTPFASSRNSVGFAHASQSSVGSCVSAPVGEMPHASSAEARAEHPDNKHNAAASGSSVRIAVLVLAAPLPSLLFLPDSSSLALIIIVSLTHTHPPPPYIIMDLGLSENAPHVPGSDTRLPGLGVRSEGLFLGGVY
ncbi:hypothetical protein B0H12DRAFT_1324942 [Mycena haematopus]|nr:hypothetical protein B0H12DRAFT_1324942 [Mycena haematopus]